jgi:hypothetical protein
MAFQLQKLGTGVASFKGGLYGFAGGGKTHTATLFALGIRKHFGLKGPLGFFDTETGYEYVNPMVVAETGMEAVGAKSRALSDAIDFIDACVKAEVSVAIIDSTTHIWEEVQKSYLASINKVRERKRLDPQSSIQWNDRNTLNEIWQKFTDAYLNSHLHIIICGRAANIWETEVNEETGKKELNKAGTKMKTQSDMAYEPSFLAEMARVQSMEGGVQKVSRVMTVLKDRFRLLDGKQFENPTFDTILPHVKLLTPGATNAVDTSRSTEIKVSEGNGQVEAERRKRNIYCEEITGLLTSTWPGQSAEEKKFKTDIVFELLGTRSWEAVQGMPSHRLKEALDAMPALIDKIQLARLPEENGGKKHKAGDSARKEAV